MLDLETVTPGERETVRVFAVDLPLQEAKAWVQVHRNIETAIGAPLNGDHMESFAAEDLTGMGLARFLVDGYGIAEEGIPSDRTELDTAGPYILLIRARAFGGEAVDLEPKAPLIPLGVFAQAGAALPGPMPTSAAETAAPEPAPSRDPTPSSNGPLIAILIFFGVALVLFFFLIVAKL